MEANAAPNGGGGGVFWDAVDGAVEPGIGKSGMLIQDNTAAYGNDVATVGEPRLYCLLLDIQFDYKHRAR